MAICSCQGDCLEGNRSEASKPTSMPGDGVSSDAFQPGPRAWVLGIGYGMPGLRLLAAKSVASPLWSAIWPAAA